MTPYSQDLRQQILDTAWRGEGALSPIADRFLVSVSFVARRLRARDPHRSCPGPSAGRSGVAVHTLIDTCKMPIFQGPSNIRGAPCDMCH